MEELEQEFVLSVDKDINTLEETKLIEEPRNNDYYHALNMVSPFDFFDR